MSFVFDPASVRNVRPYKELRPPIQPEQAQSVAVSANDQNIAVDPKAFFPGQTVTAVRSVQNLQQFEEFLRRNFPEVKACLSPGRDIPGLEAAEILITSRLRSGRPVALIFDYDMDGIASARIIAATLRILKPDLNIKYYPVTDRSRNIPDNLIEASKNSACDLLLFLDLGTYQNDAVKKARLQNQSVIVIDHHQSANFISDANVFINPAGISALRDHPSAYLAARLSQRLTGELTEEVKILATLGIAADGVSLTPDNRLMAAMGIEAFRRSDIPYIRALKKSINKSAILFSDLAIKLLPRINSARRGDLISASELCRLFFSANHREADELVRKMELTYCLNRTQKDLLIARQREDLSNLRIRAANLQIFVKDWFYSTRQEANRLCRECCQPVFVLNRLRDSAGTVTELSGSAKVPDNDLYDLSIFLADDEIQQCLTKDSSGQTQIRGHRNALHLSIIPQKLSEFSNRANYLIGRQLSNQKILFFRQPVIEVPLALIRKDGLAMLSRISSLTEPAGPGFYGPLFLLKNLMLADKVIVGEGFEQPCRMMLSQNSDGLDVTEASSFIRGVKYLKPGNRIDVLARLIAPDSAAKKPLEFQRAGLLIEAVLRPAD